MKKILSMILALAMLISLVPAAFADGEATQEYSGIKVEYNLVKGPGYDYSSDKTTNLKEVTYETTNGFWAYHSGMDDSISFTGYNSYVMQLKTAPGEWAALKINVPKAGKYDVMLKYGQMKGNGTFQGANDAGVWILPLINPKTGKEYTKEEITAALNDDLAHMANLDMFEDKGKYNYYDKFVGKLENFQFEDKGDYLVVFKSMEGSESYPNSGWMYPSAITLDGHGDYIPMTLATTLDKSELALGSAENSTATMAVTGAYMSDCGTTPVDVDSVSYSSSNVNVATVDATTGLITAEGFGQATITATAIVEGYTVSTSKDINVSVEYSGIKIKYNLVKGPGYNYDVNRSEDLRKVTYETTNGFWGYYAQSTASNGFTGCNGTVVKMKTLPGDWVALKINVPENGKYDVTFDYGKMKDHTNFRAANEVSVCILPLINAETGKEYTEDEITAALNAGSVLNTTLDMCNDGSTSNTTPAEQELGSLPFNEGDYLVVLKSIKGSTTYPDDGYIYPSAITLDGQGDYIPMTLATTLDKTDLSIGSTATMAVTGAYMSDCGTELKTATGVSYSSSNPNVATVDANGLITAKGNGTATITATATVDGYTASASRDVIVDVPYSGVTVKYGFGVDAGYGFAKYQSLLDVEFANTKGFWQIYGKSNNWAFDVVNGYCAYFTSRVGDWIALEIYVPKAGKYDVTLNHGFMKDDDGTTSGAAQKAGMWILPLINETTGAEYTRDQITEALTEETAQTVKLDFLNDDYTKGNNEGTTPAGSYYFPEAGSYLAVYKALAAGNSDAEKAYMYLGTITLDGDGTDVAPMALIASLDKEELTLGSDTDATAQMSVGTSVYMNDGTEAAVGSVSYASGKESVATVNASGLITAVGTGTATITASATATSGETSYPLSAKRNIKVVDKIATDEVSSVQFMATSTIANNAGVTTNIDGYTVGSTTDAIAPGETVAVTANDVDGYIFRGWKRGSADNGVWVSESKVYSFPLLTNTYLTAIYDVDTAEDADVNVEFYNFNGQFITSKAINGAGFGTLASGVSPTLTGYNSFFWTIDGENPVAEDKVFDKLTRVVAKFTDKDSFDVTVPVNVISDKPSGTYEYDTDIVMGAANAGVWSVNDKPVAYGQRFAYTVWSAATITFEEKANDGKPILSLDGNITDGARMMSYDANGATIVEAGILFGAKATINSAQSRAVSRKARGNVSGQFTAKPYADADADNATAYLIYNDKGTYRVIYAD